MEARNAKGFYDVEKNPADEMKENGEENHLELSSSSEPETMFEVRVMYDPSLDLQEELMRKTIREARMRKLIEDIRKVAHVLNTNTAHCRRLSEENSYLLDELKILVNSIEISILEGMNSDYSYGEIQDFMEQ